MTDPSDSTEILEHHIETLNAIRNDCKMFAKGDENSERICLINTELQQGLNIIDGQPKSVTIFGSARTPETDSYYQKIVRIAERASQSGYTIISGGGPGMMEAANRGSHQAGGTSIGATIKLPFEQSTNPYVNLEVPFYYFFTRKVVMSYSAEAYVYAPGGFGTLDELFEILTLMQTKKIPRVPVILVGEAFWNPLEQFIENILEKEFETISPEDRDLYIITDDEDLVHETIINAAIRERG